MQPELFQDILKTEIPEAEAEPLAWAQIVQISHSLTSDLAPLSGGRYSKEVQEQVTRQAALRLAKLLASTTPLSAGQAQVAWTGVVRDFHKQKQWGFSVDKKTSRSDSWSPEVKQMLPYLWVMVQTLVIMKIAVYYFGLLASAEPSREHDLYLSLALGFSALSLFYFAYRMYKKEKRSEP